ncbi:hypothetical protein ABPG75_009936 [Micractinium tetrahymenae]
MLHGRKVVHSSSIATAWPHTRRRTPAAHLLCGPPPRLCSKTATTPTSPTAAPAASPARAEPSQVTFVEYVLPLSHAGFLPQCIASPNQGPCCKPCSIVLHAVWC